MSLLEAYTAAPAFFYAGVFVLGLCIGSFLNVVIYRLPKMMHNSWQQECYEYLADKDPSITKPAPPARFNLATPNSSCPKCSAAIQPWQNIPFISWLLLKGKCANCNAPISIRYPGVELATGLLSVLLLAVLGPSLQTAFGLVLLWCLIALTMIDIDEQLLPDSITLPLLWLGLLINLYELYTPLEDAVIGAIAGYLCLWSVYRLFKLATGKEGMGFGDFKLLAALGAWMGWQYLPLIVILSSLVGAVLGIGMIALAGKDRAKPMPFGPYLAIAGFIAFLWGDKLLANYLQLFALQPQSY